MMVSDSLVINLDFTKRYTAVSAVNAQWLRDYISGMSMPEGDNVFPLWIVMPCGEMYKGGVPEKSLPCTCGNPEHWFVKYEEVYR
uniref:Uncharacterized protein n=2 Tax=viral metagenome TaxID=1070528 RepID=A0A6M3K8Z8_9ZZZZ